MAFEKARQSSLVEHVVTQVEQSIVSGVFQPGERLPSVRDLQEALGASRGTLREALRVLEQKGLIEVRVGSKGGAFVKEATTEPLAEDLALLIRQRRVSVDHLAEFRQVVESGLIRLVCKNIRGKDTSEMRRFLSRLKNATAKGAEGWHEFLDVEVELRKRLIRIAGNPMYEAVLVPIHENIFTYGYEIPGEDANVEEAYEDWRGILEAIERGNAERAAFITREHIGRYAERIKRHEALAALADSAPHTGRGSVR